MLFLGLVILLIGCPLHSFAETEGKHVTLTLKCEEQIVCNTPFEVALWVKPDSSIAMAQMDINYDSQVLTLVKAKETSLLKTAPTINDTKPGHIYFVWDSLRPVTEEGIWLTCEFIAHTEGETSVSVNQGEYLLFSGSDLVKCQVEVIPAHITVINESETEASGSGDDSVGGSEESKTENGSHAEDNALIGENDGLTMNVNSSQTEVGTQVQLSVNEEEAVYWESSNEAIATVENGIVTPVREGTVTITAYSEDGLACATCVLEIGPIESAEDEQADPSGETLENTEFSNQESDKSANQIQIRNKKTLFVFYGFIMAAGIGAAAVLLIKLFKKHH